MAHGFLTSPPVRGRQRREVFISAVQYDEQLRSGGMSVLDLAPRAAAFGVQGVEYRDVYWRDKRVELPEAKRQLAQLKLRVAYTTMAPLYHPDPAVQKRLLRDIEDARDLGATLLRVNLGQRPGTGPADAAIHYAGRMAVERAAALRVRLTLENNSKAPDHLLSDVRQTLVTFSCRFFGTNLDFANYVTTGQDPIAAIRALTRWINYVHAKDVRNDCGWVAVHVSRERHLAPEGDHRRPGCNRQAVSLLFRVPGRRRSGARDPPEPGVPGDAGGDPERGIRQSLEFLATLEG